MGKHLGIDFKAILVDFERQVGLENRVKNDAGRTGKIRSGHGMWGAFWTRLSWGEGVYLT